MNSAIYSGWVSHRRRSPREHAFRYRVFMPYLDLDELPTLFKGNWLWSASGRAPAQFRRGDFLGDPAETLDEAVRSRVCQEVGRRPSGPIRLLANLRYFGHIINPISCYYCFAEDGETLEYLVAEVTNTPWNERHSYVLEANSEGPWLETEFDKRLHVSPFNPMGMKYHWRSNTPQDKLVLKLASSEEGNMVFDAALSLQRQEASATVLNSHLLRYPLMSMKVAAAIYWQALRLKLKGNPFHPHPKTINSEQHV